MRLIRSLRIRRFVQRRLPADAFGELVDSDFRLANRVHWFSIDGSRMPPRSTLKRSTVHLARMSRGADSLSAPMTPPSHVRMRLERAPRVAWCDLFAAPTHGQTGSLRPKTGG
jgi:hypothetical protein